MLKIAYNSIKGRGEIYFDGRHFDDYRQVCKSAHLQFDPDGKCWTGSPAKILSIVYELMDFEQPIFDPPDTIRTLENSKNSFVPETVFVRNPYMPELLKVPPYKGKPPYEDFQVDATKKGIRQNRFAYFLGMGLGKTKISIDILNHLFAYKSIEHVLIIAPSEGIYNWKVELMKFNSWGLKEEQIYIANAENRNPFDSETIVAIMTYRTFLMLSDDYYKRNVGGTTKKYKTPPITFEGWGDSEHRAIILDESHKIKNGKARQTYVLGLHKKSFKYRYLLTGTPTPNLFTEIYTQMKFLDEGLVPSSYTEFIQEIANLGNRFSDYAINYVYKEKREQYEKRFAPWVMRLKTNEAIDLPPLYVKEIYTELPTKQKKIYQKLVEHTLTVLKENKEGDLEAKDVYQKFPYMSQALDNPCLLEGKITDNDELSRLVDHFKFEEHGKLEATKSLVEEYIDEENRKMIIFDYHPLTIDQLAEVFKKYNPLVIHGQNTPAGRDQSQWRSEVISEFKADPSRHLLIASEIVLSVAVNLQEATRAIYFSRNYSYTDWVQSQARLHRIGTKEPVIINPMIFLDSLDIRLDMALRNKEDLNSSIFKNVKSLGINEWRNIFKGK